MEEMNFRYGRYYKLQMFSEVWSIVGGLPKNSTAVFVPATIFVCFLYIVHDMNAFKAGSVCLSAGLFSTQELQNGF
jgi:hypothetical protein